MVGDELRRLVERTFADPSDDAGGEAEFRRMVLEALEAGRNLSFLGRRLGCEPWEIAALKKIEEAHRSGIAPDSA